MAEYQVLARKWRPQTFREVLGQQAVVTTLKNAIKQKRLAHAYLFCGSRGTGKTTLARVFAKALNCQKPTDDGEPCNTCSSCKEITSGSSLDVLEIDGASNRGIEDIRQINETVGYTTASGNYKIYIIDEVHMLTKEAFNALLKTLEEPPPKVKFFFATTEPHKVLPTILSRCQRFNLSRIAPEIIVSKLKRIAEDQGVSFDLQALYMVATRAEGGLRDAESLFDQILAFHEGPITVDAVAAVLGVMPANIYFALDRAGKEGNLGMVFEVSHQLFSQGKDFLHFIDGMIEHFRTLLLLKLGSQHNCEKDLKPYLDSAELYSKEQCLNIIEMLVEAQNKIRFAPSPRIALEALLLRVLRTHQHIPVEVLVKRLSELENALRTPGNPQVQPQAAAQPQPPTPPEPPRPTPLETPRPTPPAGAQMKAEVDKKTQSKYDTLFQFAAVELEGTLKKKGL